MIKNWESNKRRAQNILNKLKAKDTAFRHLSTRTEDQLQAITLAF